MRFIYLQQKHQQVSSHTPPCPELEPKIWVPVSYSEWFIGGERESLMFLSLPLGCREQYVDTVTEERIAALCRFSCPQCFLTSVFALLFVTFCPDRGLTRGLSHRAGGEYPFGTWWDCCGTCRPVTVLWSLCGPVRPGWGGFFLPPAMGVLILSFGNCTN